MLLENGNMDEEFKSVMLEQDMEYDEVFNDDREDPHAAYWFSMMDVARHLRDWGATETVKDLKNSYPKEYKALQMAILEELPK
jgi:hypothetical protein